MILARFVNEARAQGVKVPFVEFIRDDSDADFSVADSPNHCHPRSRLSGDGCDIVVAHFLRPLRLQPCLVPCIPDASAGISLASAAASRRPICRTGHP